MAHAQRERHRPAQAVADDHRIGTQTGMVHDGNHVVAEQRGRIRLPMVAVAHAGQVRRHHVKTLGKPRRDEIPPVGVRHRTVDQHQSRQAGRAPGAVAQQRAVVQDFGLADRRLQRFADPGRRARIRFPGAHDLAPGPISRRPRLGSPSAACRFPDRHKHPRHRTSSKPSPCLLLLVSCPFTHPTTTGSTAARTAPVPPAARPRPTAPVHTAAAPSRRCARHRHRP